MKALVSKGNSKLGKDTFIINITSAVDCPSKRMCQLTNINKCYALKAEHRWPAVLPYRRSQTKVWDSLSVDDIANQLILKCDRVRNDMKYLRFSESGDFRTQNDISKMSNLADKLKNKLKVYGYTARRDLNFKDVSENMCVNGSGFMVHNSYTAVTEYNNSDIVCEASCENCDYCKSGRNRLKIQIKVH